MKLVRMAVLLGMTFSVAALADQGGVKYEVVLTRDGKVISAPMFLGEFGKPAIVEQDQTMRIEAVASAPDKDGNSLASVKLQLFENGEMRPLREMSMRADLSKAPSVEYTVPGTNARFTFRPSLVKLAALK
jgi:hypothetical protein